MNKHNRFGGGAWVWSLLLACAAGLVEKPASAQTYGFGAAIAGGNFNGRQEAYSAQDELVIGSPWEPLTGSGAHGTGAVYVYVNNGTAMWAPNSLSFQPTAFQVYRIDQSYFSAGDGGREDGDNFGSVFAVGDFNGDGRKDLAIGVPSEDLPNAPDAGCVHVLFGAANSGTRWPFFEKAYLTRSITYAWSLVATPQTGDRFGAALVAGDFDGDGDDDLAIGAPGVTINGKASAGAVFVFSGGSSTFSRSFEYTFYEGGDYSPTGTGTAQAGDRFGESLAAGNFNSDLNGTRSLVDLAIGAPGAKVGSADSAGKVIVLHGSTSRLNNNSALPPQIWTQANVPGDSVEAYDNFGSTLVAANFNRRLGAGAAFEDPTKNFDDLAIGTPWEDVTVSGTSYTDAGLVQVLYGYKSGLTTTQAPSSDADRDYSHAAQTFHHKTVTGMSTSPQDDARFGSSLAAGDVLQQNGGCQGNSCNPNDLIVGEINYSSGKGQALVIDGTTLGLSLASWRVVAPDSSAAGAQFSVGMSVLRFGLGYNQPNNASGALAMDLIVGAPNIPRAHVYFGRDPSDFSTDNISGLGYPGSGTSPPF